MSAAVPDLGPGRLVRLLTSSDTPARLRAALRVRSSERPLQSTVLTGTPLQFAGKRGDTGVKLPKLPAELRAAARKLKITPRTRKGGEVRLQMDRTSSSMNSTSKGSLLRDTTEVTSEFIHRINQQVAKIHFNSSQSPQRQDLCQQRTLDCLPKSFTELEAVAEQPHLNDSSDGLNSSGILMTCKANPTSDSADAPHRPKKPKQPEASKPPISDISTLVAVSLYSEFCFWVAQSNGIVSEPGEGNYKFYLGPGNNCQLIAFLMKKRWFWTRVDNLQQADFIWTQHKQSSIMDKLPTASIQPVVVLPDPTQPSFPKRKGFRPIYDSERRKSTISLITTSQSYTWLLPPPEDAQSSIQIYNRLDRNYQLTSKKHLYLNMKSYYEETGRDVFQDLPLTFLVQGGRNDPEMTRFEERFRAEEESKAGEKGKKYNLWIIKPGENSNCGHGIHVSSDLSEIQNLVSFTKTVTGRRRTYIVQKYMEKPLLVNKRKFDIRCYALITAFGGHIQGYFYHDGYLRTSSKEYTLKNLSNRFIHLTNDAVQKKSDDYGKFENGNKLNYQEFQRYLEATYPGQVDFWRDLWPEIRRIVGETVRATYRCVDPWKRKHTFEVLGYDFMIDENFKVWLIEVNTNPCLSISSAYLAKLIPAMLDNAFRIAVDPYFLEPSGRKHRHEWASQPWENRFELIFSSVKDGNACSDPISPASLSSLSSESEDN